MTKDIENPETIEIHGLKTIHKLCKFGADNNMEGCTFTEIVERMFLELKKLEGCVVVPVEPTDLMINAYRDNSVAPVSTLSVSGYKAMLAAVRGGNE